MNKDNEEEWRRMPLPRYEVSKRLSLSVFRMTKMVPPKVKVSTSNPPSNIGLGIMHLLAVYGDCLFKSNEEKGNVFKEMVSLMGRKDWTVDEAMMSLIQGGTEGKASRSSYAADIVSKTLTHFSSLCLARSYQTASWKRVLGKGVETATYVIFFIVTPRVGDQLYNETRAEGGEYLQMAVCDTAARLLSPCNSEGSAFILGKDLEDLCNHGNHAETITEALNKVTCHGKRGIYPPVRGEPKGLRRVRLGGVYELKKAVPAKRFTLFP